LLTQPACQTGEAPDALAAEANVVRAEETYKEEIYGFGRYISYSSTLHLLA